MATHDEKTVPDPTPTRRILRMDATIWAMTAGLLCGLGLFIATNWLLLQGGHRVGEHLGLLGNYFIGYRVTFLGSLIGFAYAFAIGFAATWIFVRVYNWVAQVRHAGAR
jgi:hypothetical protein